MRITVRLFAILRERAGVERLELELPSEVSVAEALELLGGRPEIGDVLAAGGFATAVNLEYAPPGRLLSDGDELALIPPVSGGSPDAPEVHARVSAEPLRRDLAELVRRPGAGAIVTFEGTTRDVPYLLYEAYAEMAEPLMERILSECMARHGLQAIAAEHRVGSVALSEPAVVVAASAAHRDQAFAGAREAIDRIKAELPIWKREVLPDGGQRAPEGLP